MCNSHSGDLKESSRLLYDTPRLWEVEGFSPSLISVYVVEKDILDPEDEGSMISSERSVNV